MMRHLDQQIHSKDGLNIHQHDFITALNENAFSLVYQPILNIHGEGPPAIEALLRWYRGGQPFSGPSEFIPIAEQCGAIIQLGEWVLDEACRQCAQWRESGFLFSRIAVNVSALQLSHPSFADRLLDICSTRGWPTDRLELELTESALFRDCPALRDCFQRLTVNGVTFAIDDFGTGFSNLHYLNRYPVRRLKIDRRFVCQLLDNKTTADVVAQIIQLGHALDMRVVAEGIEHIQEKELLNQQGCDEIQGYWYSHPLSAHAMAEWLQRRGTIPSVANRPTPALPFGHPRVPSGHG